MTDFAKKIVEVQRLVHQSFLMVEEHCDPKTIFARKRAGTSPLFQLEQSIKKIYTGMEEMSGDNASDEELEMFSAEAHLLRRSAERLSGLLDMINATESVWMLSGDIAHQIITRTEQAYRDLQKRHPFEKEDIEARMAHVVYALFLEAAECIRPTNIPLPQVSTAKHVSIGVRDSTTEKLGRHIELMNKILDQQTLVLQKVGEVEKHGPFSTEKVVKDLNHMGEKGQPKDLLDTFKLEQCQASTRAIRLEECMSRLLTSAANETSTSKRRQIANAVCTLLHVFVARAKPKVSTSTDSIIFFNDCMYVVVMASRSKFDTIYKSSQPMDAYNFSTMLNVVRAEGRKALNEYLKDVKSNYLTWPDNALHNYVPQASAAKAKSGGKCDDFTRVLQELDRLAAAWQEVHHGMK